MNKLIGEIIYNIGGFYKQYETIEEFLSNSFWGFLYVKLSVMYSITFVILLPLCLLKDVSKLGVTSLLGIVTFIFILVVVLLQFPSYSKNYWDKIYKQDDPSTYLNIFHFSSGFDKNLYFVKGTATIFFFYSCHPCYFPIMSSLKKNDVRRIHKVIKRGLLINTFLFIILGIFGYLTCPVGTPALIIERNNIKEGPDILMSICKLSVVIVVIMKLPINFNIFKISFFQLFIGDSELTIIR